MKVASLKTITAALFAVTVGSAMADAGADWTGNGADTKFSTVENWDGNAGHTATLPLRFNGQANKTVTFDAAYECTGGYNWVGSTTAGTYTDGTTAKPVIWDCDYNTEYGLTCSGNLVIADLEGQNGALKIVEGGTYSFPKVLLANGANSIGYFDFGGTALTLSGAFDMACGNAAATYIQRAGTVKIGANSYWAADGTGVAKASILGGAMLFDCDLILGNGNTSGSATITVANGGVLQVGTDPVARWLVCRAGTNVLNLNEGGTLSAWHIEHYGDVGTMALNFNGGAWRFNGISGYGMMHDDKGNDATVFTVGIGEKGAIIASDFDSYIPVAVTSLCDSGTTDGGLIKVGTGTLTLNEKPTFTGPITVKCGSVVIPTGSTYKLGEGTQVTTSGDTLVFTPKRKTIIDLDFEDESTYTDGWSFSGNGYTTWTNHLNTTDHFLEIWSGDCALTGKTRTHTATYSVTESELLGATDYNMTFDTFAGFGTTSPVECYTKLLDSNNSTIFWIDEPQSGTSKTVYFKDANDATLGTYNLTVESQLNKGARALNADATPANWLSVSVNAKEGLGVFLTVLDYKGTVLLASVRVSDYAVPATITVRSQTRTNNGNQSMGIDNIVVSVPAAANLPNDPTITVDENSILDEREVTITANTTGDGAVTYYYLSSQGESSKQQIPDGETSVTITVKSSDTVVAYTTNEAGSSSKTELEVQACVQIKLNPPTLYRAGFTTLAASASQDSVQLTPTPTIKYAIDGGEEQSADAVNTDDQTHFTIPDKVGTVVKVWATCAKFVDSDPVEYKVKGLGNGYRVVKGKSMDYVKIRELASSGTLAYGATNRVEGYSGSTLSELTWGAYNLSSNFVYYSYESKDGKATMRWGTGTRLSVPTFLKNKYTNVPVVIDGLKAGQYVELIIDGIAQSKQPENVENLTKTDFNDENHWDRFYSVDEDGYAVIHIGAGSSSSSDYYIFGLRVWERTPGFSVHIR